MSFTNNCDQKITGEHFATKGILEYLSAGKVAVEKAPWLGIGETKIIGINSLVSNILCKRHNSAFSGVDSAAVQFFGLLNEIAIDFARSSSLEQENLYLFSGEDLEIWACKTLLGLLYSQPQNSSLREYNVNHDIIAAIARTGRLPQGHGIYVNGRTGLNQVHKSHEFTIRPITHERQKRLIGLELVMAGLPIHFFLDSLGVNFEYERTHKIYRPSFLRFQNGNRAHSILLSWLPNDTGGGLIFNTNGIAEQSSGDYALDKASAIFCRLYRLKSTSPTTFGSC